MLATKKLLLAMSLCALIAGSCVAVPALASRKPTHAEARAITKAFKTTKKAGLGALAKQFNVVRIRISTLDPRYARASFVAKPKFRSTFQPGYGVAKRHANGRWKALDVGSESVGCGKVPKRVRGDLKLVCP